MGQLVLKFVIAIAVLLELVYCEKGSKLPKLNDFGKSKKKSPSGKILPNVKPANKNHGFAVSNGKLTGQAKVQKDKLRYDAIVQAQDKNTDHEFEQQVLSSQAEFNQWLQEYKNTGVRPAITPQVQSEIDAGRISLDQLESNILKDRKKSSRRKRSAVMSGSGIWDKCIIPYMFAPLNYTDAASKTAVRQGIAVYEKFTGFRFREYSATNTTPGDNSQWGLNHNSYLRFIKSGGCWSFVGNRFGYPLNSTEGQDIATCDYVDTVLHELGHAIGFLHENQFTSSMDWMRVNFENILPGSRQWYNRFGRWTVVNFDQSIYDPSSVMHYGDWMFNANYGKTMSFLDSEDDYLFEKEQHNVFYMLTASQMYHGCFNQYPSCNPLPTCSMGGVVSVIDGACKCVCPEGLDPATGCTTKATGGSIQWPLGSYSMLKSAADTCPTGFDVGSSKQYPPDFHWQGGSYVDAAQHDWYSMTQKVCTKSNGATGAGVWPPGSYCILRKGGVCPSGFSDGRLSYTLGRATDTISGVLPDGSHDTVNEYMFCCRNDGTWDNEIELPMDKSIILFRKGGYCQKVARSYSISEYFNFQHQTGYPLIREGSLPSMYSFEFYSDPFYRTFFNVDYCAYIPVNSDNCGVVKTFTATDTVYTFATPGYPSAAPTAKSCMWHFTSPAGTKMRLSFDSFDVASDDEQCNSYVEIKNWYPGFKEGFKICGHNYENTIWTKQNYLTVKFVTDLGQQTSGFSARVTIEKADSKCYSGDGSDGVYTGRINYVNDFKPCLPWNKVSKCHFHQFDTRTLDDDLDGNNFCRNTGVGQRPWCYIDEETCERQECDACAYGQCFDIFTDCGDLIAADPDFCANNALGEAQRGCMESCGLCANRTAKPPATQVSCTMPEDIQGIGPSKQPGQSSFPVGAIVNYTCPTTGNVRTRVCTSEGTWSRLNTVCGVCPIGWSVFQKRCYKWLGYNETRDYSSAKSTCEALGGRLPKIDSAERNQYLYELVDFDKYESESFWLGLKKRTGETIWRWRDGSALSWANWASTEPTSTNCIAFNGDTGKWYDTSCTTNKQDVVCEIELPDADSACNCEDGRKDCAALLQNDPDLCILRPDYAWHNCRKTCAIGACNSGGTCDDSATNLGSSGQRIRGSSLVNVGNYTEYNCNSGYYLTGGNLKRACLPGGTLTGAPPVCSTGAIATAVELFPNVVIRRRNAYHYGGIILTSNNANMLITIPGKITTWKYYSNYAGGEVAFIVLRLISGSYKVIGKNVVSNTPEDRKAVVNVPANQQITVNVNDMVAVYASGDEISYTMCDPAIMPQHTGWSESLDWFSSAASITVGSTYDFSSVAVGAYGYCRYYSIQATVDP